MDLLSELKNTVSAFNNHVTIFENRDGFYKARAWVRTRVYILRRDNNECRPCADRGLVTTNNLIVHHIEPLEYVPSKGLDESNLITVCIRCHNYIHGSSFERKANKWADEWW